MVVYESCSNHQRKVLDTPGALASSVVGSSGRDARCKSKDGKKVNVSGQAAGSQLPQVQV